MKHMKLLGVLLVVAFALSAVAAGAAFAAEPEYLVKLSPFTGTKAVEAEANGVQTLKSTGLTIECKKFGLAAGAVIEGGAPGKSKETIQYSECAVAGFALCKIFETASLTGAGKITTEALTNKLAYETEAAALGLTAPYVVVFETTVKNTFAKFFLEEAKPGSKECPATGSITVEGDAVITKALGKDDEDLVTHEIEAPATAIKTYWTNNGKDESHKINGLKVIGLAATYSGKAKVKLTSKEEYSISSK